MKTSAYMTVQDLIDVLNKIEDKSAPVIGWSDLTEGWEPLSVFTEVCEVTEDDFMIYGEAGAPGPLGSFFVPVHIG